MRQARRTATLAAVLAAAAWNASAQDGDAAAGVLSLAKPATPAMLSNPPTCRLEQSSSGRTFRILQTPRG
jgi:hypothetical protein